MQTTPHPCDAAAAFDRVAASYDTVFTETSIGRAQRTAVWKYAQKVYVPHGHLLELNCGTGEDALHFARLGYRVTACDVSAAMIEQARKKVFLEDLCDRIRFYVKSTERINEIAGDRSFSGVFSNFSGLNCVKDLGDVAHALAPMLLPSSPLLLCVSTRCCLWEIVWYVFHGDNIRAFRRWGGHHKASLGEVAFSVYYPSCGDIRKSFAPYFRFVSVTGIGITVPPSYADSMVSRYPRLLCVLDKTDNAIRHLPGLRVLGDHMLLHFERLPA